MSNKHSPEDKFMELLNEWRDNLVEGSDLNMTTMERKHDKKSAIWRHYQYTGKLGDPVGYWYGRLAKKLWITVQDFLDCSFFCCSTPEAARDEEKENAKVNDYYSPCKPNVYIKLRLDKHKDFYQQRIPGYVRQRNYLHTIAVTATASGAIFGYYSQQGAVAAISAFAAAITSVSEFLDVGRKLERYSNAIRSIKKLVAWWESLSDVDQSSVPNITKLVLDGERIIMGELSGWGSERQKKTEGKAEDESKGKANAESSSHNKQG